MPYTHAASVAACFFNHSLNAHVDTVYTMAFSNAVRACSFFSCQGKLSAVLKLTEGSS